MNKKVKGLIGIILSLIVLIFFEEYFYKIIGVLGINISSYSNIIQLIINIFVKFIMCFLIYFIYKKDLKKKSGKFNIIKNILIFIVSLIVLTLVMYLFNKYVVAFIGDVFNINIIYSEFYNIFNKTINLELIIKIVNDYIIVPYLYCSVIILSADKLCSRNDTYILLSGLFALIVNALIIRGTVGYAIINSLSIFLIFCILAFLNRKENSIWFSIILYSLYLICNVFIMNYFGWYL